MNSTPKTIAAAAKAAATCKQKCLERIGSVGTVTSAIPVAYRRWLKTLELEGKIEYRVNGDGHGMWYVK